jgi:hypothetical protein
MHEERKCTLGDSEVPEGPGGDPDAWLSGLKLGVELPEREFRLYARYVRALALLCECASYVDDEDYSELIDELLADACKHYPLECLRDGDHRALRLRESEVAGSEPVRPQRTST